MESRPVRRGVEYLGVDLPPLLAYPACTVFIMFSLARQAWLSFRQHVAGTLQAVREPGLPTWRDALLRLPLVVGFVVLPTAALLLIRTEPIGALAAVVDSITFLGALLGAQAAVAALTLAVMLFLMQGVSARRDVDDRIYAEYIRQSWVWPVFCSSIGAVALTGAVLTVERIVGDAGAAAQGVPGVSNLAVLAVAAFVVSLAAPVALFWRAIMLAEPEHWQRLRLDVNKQEVKEAVSAYLGRIRRVDLGVLIPERGERSANQAIQALLDDARRAMDERRHGELVRSLNSIQTLVSYAMDEIETDGVEWRPLGSNADWPPVWELGHLLYSFREDVIRAGNRDYLLELLSLDHWFISTGLRRPCGELFTFGLYGYRANYEISTRVGSRDFHGMLRDQFLSNLEFLTFGQEPEALTPFMLEVIRHQGNVLAYALHANRVDDFRWLQSEFGSILSNILERWNSGAGFSGDQLRASAHLAQENRVALMGLAGRAAILADSGELTDATPFLAVAREVYSRPSDLARDISAALSFERSVSNRQWEDWEVPEHIGAWSGTLSLERYPLTCFAVLLMGFTDDATLDLNLGGNARRVLQWFSANSERLERFVPHSSSASPQQRRQFAIEVLRNAAERDEVEADLETIRREIDSRMVDAYKSDVSSGMDRAASVQRLFNLAGAVLVLEASAQDAPAERGHRELLPKACFIAGREDDQIYVAPINGEDDGRRLARDAVHLLCEAAEGAARVSAPLGTMGEVLHAIDTALEDLNPQGNAVVVLAGESHDLFLYSRAYEIEEYEPSWLPEEADSLINVGRYRGYPILRRPTSGEREVYVVDLGTWGRFVRAPFGKGQDLHIDVLPIAPERAEELLQARPGWFPDQPDHESKMRKLQTHVEVIVGVRHGFRVDDPTRARRIVPEEPSGETGSNETESVSGQRALGPSGATMAREDTPA